MYIEQIVLEVTRSCNLNCVHCCRGCSQKIHFNPCYLDNIFNGIDSIGCITFTGGEPLLKIGTIIKVLDYIREHKISLGGFYIVHNGTIFSKYLLNILHDYYENYVDEKEMCGFSLSTDRFHLNQIRQAKLRNRYYDYIELRDCFGFEFIYDDRKEIFSLIESGRGKQNKSIINTKYGSRKASFYNGFVMNEYGSYSDTLIYISANGNVISDCDLSYDVIDMLSFGNIKKTDLIDIIKSHTIEEDNLKKIEI